MDNINNSLLSVLASSLVRVKVYDARLFEITRNVASPELIKIIDVLEEQLCQPGDWPEVVLATVDRLTNSNIKEELTAGLALKWAVHTWRNHPWAKPLI